MYFKANGSVNSLEFKLTDEDGKCFSKKWRDVTGPTNWTRLEVPVQSLKCLGPSCKDENEKVDLTKVIAYGFAISDKAGEEGGAGEVTIGQFVGYMDRNYVVPNLSSIVSSIFPSYISLDDMNSLEGWKIQHREGATGTVHLDNSSYGIDMDYDLGANTSFEMSKRKGFSIFGEDINKVKKLGVYFKANGSVNSLEFKLTDEDGKCFFKKWRDVTGPTNWTRLEVPVQSLKCLGSSCKDENEKVDLTKVIAYGFAISDRAGEEGGAGEVTISGVVGSY